jgi:hypothetical protein
MSNIITLGFQSRRPSGSVHRVAQNPSGKTTTRLLAVIVHRRDAKQVTVREKDQE